MDVELPEENKFRNPFRNHYEAFRDGILSLFELELITYAWSYKNSALWNEVSPPTEPFIRYNEKETAFKKRKENWNKSLHWIKIKNWDSKDFLRQAKRFLFNSELDMLDQELYEKGLKLYEFYKQPLF